MCACNSVKVFTIDGHKFMIFLRNSYPHTHIFRFIAKKWRKNIPYGCIRCRKCPFGTSELLARIRASLRHSNRLRTDSTFYIRPYRHGEMTLDFSRRLLKIGQDPVHLTPIEYKIVAFLAQNSGKVVTYSTILSNVWGPYADGDNKILRVNMANIRRKIETDPAQPKYIYTEVGVGYRMAEDEDDSQMM